MIVSIDIGTSYSSISFLSPEGKAQPVDIGTGVSMFGSRYSLPSAVFAEEDGKLLLGQDALNSRMRKPQNFRDEFKRNLGEVIPIMLGSRSYLPEELYTEFFRHMKACAEKVGGTAVRQAYLTYPASYGKLKKDKITAAARAAGLFDTILVDEPTAAAMSYCAAGYIKDGQNLLIYDFGGGTFDVSVIRYENGNFRLLSEPKGLERCGGIDMDRLIYQDMLRSVPEDTLNMLRVNNLHFMRFASQLSEMAVKAKHHLSTAQVFNGDIVVGFDTVPYKLTLERFNSMIAPLVGQTITVCRQAVEAAGLKIEDLSAVLLVGGTSRVPLVQEMVRQMVGSVSVYCAADLELAVSQGALNYRNYQSEAAPEPPPEEEKDPEALYRQGLQFEKDVQLKEAAQSYLAAAQLGHGEAMRAIGACYQRGQGVTSDYAQAIHWYQKSADQGCAAGLLSLGWMHMMGWGVPQDTDRAVQLFRQAAEQGDVNAQVNLAARYRRGDGVPQDIRQAISWYRKAADQGNAIAQYDLGMIYAQGEGIPQDRELALNWLRKAAAQEHEAAAKKVQELESEPAREPVSEAEELYRQGKEFEKNEQRAQAAENYRRAAEMGHAAAQYELGQCFEAGYGIPCNAHGAARWYRAAAEQGHAAARNDLGRLYLLGQGVPKDAAMAVSLFRQAAEQGEAAAQSNLGVRYWKGDGIQKDTYQASVWFRKSAEQGNPSGQFNLGLMYECGEGVAMNKAEALEWFRKAAAQGHEKAKAKVQELAPICGGQSFSPPVVQAAAVGSDGQIDYAATVLQTIDEIPGITRGREDFAEKSLGALMRHLMIFQREYVLLAHDDTMFKNGRNGYILTNRGIHCRDVMSQPMFTPWEEFAQCDQLIYQDYYVKLPTGKVIGYHTGTSGSLLMKDLYRRLHEKMRS